MSYVISVDNIKCSGCAETITKALSALPGVRGVSVDVAAEAVTIDGDPSTESAAAAALDKLGYPRRGGANGLLQKAKSLISSAAGRVSK